MFSSIIFFNGFNTALNFPFALIIIFFLILIFTLVVINYSFQKKQLQTTFDRKRLFIVICLLLCSYGATQRFWFAREPFHLFFFGVERSDAPKGLFKFDGDRVISAFPIRSKFEIKHRPLVLIVVDGLRKDVMNVYGDPNLNTPFLSSLFDSGNLQKFDNTKSICTSSYCGLVGLLSSRYWSQMNKTPDNLPDVLSKFGYKNYFFLSGDHTHFSNLRYQYGENISIYKDGSIEKNQYPNDDEIIHKWLNDFNPTEPSKSFLYIHLMSLHALGTQRPDNKLNLLLPPVKENARLNLERYHAGVLQADNHIEKIFNWLNKHKWLNDALIIISSDHGEYLGEFGKWKHGDLPFEPVINIPLLVHDLKNRNYPSKNIYSSVDIAPTFLHSIGVPNPIDWSGIPLQLMSNRCAVATNSTESEGLVGFIDNGYYKYLNNSSINSPGKIYNLQYSEEHQVPIIDTSKYNLLKACFDKR
jgi:membrane-anchored protein YejM (alkaline phosphatase superfamily)